jgi:hypothetical protein
MLGLRRIWNPAAYQGVGATRRYFEGWYFKQVDRREENILAVIPGVSYSADGARRHAFVQVVTSWGFAHYFAYPVEDFSFDGSAPFAIAVGPNTFSCDRMVLDLEDGGVRIAGELHFGQMTPWPVTAFSPGIMGWYRFVPGMQTYHGVLSMDHEVTGWVQAGDERRVFDGGRGYLEKDWGRSFPSSWIWAQSNHFGRPGASLTLSIARVPWMTGAFIGHIAGLLLDGRLHRFTTYTGAKLTCIEVGHNESHLMIADRHEELEIELHGCEAMILKAPELGSMEGRDAESLGGTIEVKLRALRGGRASVVFEATGRQAGIEIMDDADELGSIPCPAAR